MSSIDPPPKKEHGSKLRFFRPLLSHLPHLLSASSKQILSLSPESRYRDLRTTLTIEIVRVYIANGVNGKKTVERNQQLTAGPVTVGKNTWKADVSIPVFGAEEAGALEELVAGYIRRVAEEQGNNVEVPAVGVVGLTAEWVGNRDVKKHSKAKDGKGSKENQKESPMEPWSDERKYAAMMDEVNGGEDSAVVMFMHGGAYTCCDPNTHRPLARKLAKCLSARVFLPRYRLAPQNPFPAALLDALQSYLYLLYPPPGALHKPVPAERIVFAGDSAGGGLVFALLQLLLEINRDVHVVAGTNCSPSPEKEEQKTNETENMHSTANPTLHKLIWQGKPRPTPLPAGLAGLSPWVDLSRCFNASHQPPGRECGSEESCLKWDYLPSPEQTLRETYLASPAWPVEPKRTHMYTTDEMITHPFVSPITSKSWLGSPPIWASFGDECFRDGNYFLTHALHASSVPVRSHKYTAMPHVFQGLFPHHKSTKHSFESFVKFVRHVTGTPSSSFSSSTTNTNTNTNATGTAATIASTVDSKDKGKEKEEEGYEWKCIKINPISLSEENLSEEELKMGLEREDVLKMMEAAVSGWKKFSKDGEGVNPGRGAEAVEARVSGAKL